MCEKKALFTENPKATKAAKENRYKKKECTNVSKSMTFKGSFMPEKFMQFKKRFQITILSRKFKYVVYHYVWEI